VRIALSYYLFNEDPYNAFGERYGVPRSFWVEIFHNRYMWRGYSIPELQEIISILSRRNQTPIDIAEKTIRRWINRTEIYNKAQKAISDGVQEVTPEYFDTHEKYLMNNYKLNAR
jgi:hypothetical protein